MNGRSPEIELIDSDDDVSVHQIGVGSGTEQALSSSGRPSVERQVADDAGDDSDEDSDVYMSVDDGNSHDNTARGDLRDEEIVISDSNDSARSARSNAHANSESDDHADDSDSESDSYEMDESLTLDARNYLRKEGSMRFLEKYVPVTLGIDDITSVIHLLGFKPKFGWIRSEEEKLMFLIRFLQRAMDRVLSSRPRLQDFNSLDKLVEVLQSSSKIIVLTGAGISTSLGIPDFRSSQGFYSMLQDLGLSDPQDVFSLEEFEYDPSLFYSIAHKILPPEKLFTPLHGFIKLLQDKGKLLRNYTQNIDNLEENVGIDKDKLVQCHGSFATLTCFTCGFKVPGSTIFKEIRAQELPICPWCKNERNDESSEGAFGVMKPDITFFGEALPERYHSLIPQDRLDCDLLICIGTSLKVAPVSEIVKHVPVEVPQILINKDLVTHCEFDLSLLGYCDQVITYVCEKLGWEIDHPDFEKILNSDLRCEKVDEINGIFEVSDKSQREKELKAEAETAVEAETQD